MPGCPALAKQSGRCEAYHQLSALASEPWGRPKIGQSDRMRLARLDRTLVKSIFKDIRPQTQQNKCGWGLSRSESFWVETGSGCGCKLRRYLRVTEWEVREVLCSRHRLRDVLGARQARHWRLTPASGTSQTCRWSSAGDEALTANLHSRPCNRNRTEQDRNEGRLAGGSLRPCALHPRVRACVHD